MKEFAKKFYHSAKWQKARAEYIAYRRAYDGGLCERCGQELGYIVHHKKRITPENINNADITLNMSNFEYLCKACHNREHEAEIYGNIKHLLCVFNADGQPVEVNDRMG